MFENTPQGEKRDALVKWFNSSDNGIMVPNKRTVDGQEVVIHTNHSKYEARILSYLNSRRTVYRQGRRNYTDQKIAELIFEDVKDLSIDLEEIIINKSLLDHTNINDINFTYQPKKTKNAHLA